MDQSEFLRLARERFEFGRQADADDRAAAEADNCFANADDKDLGQWDDAAKKARRRRPILQWNRIPVYVQQVVNDGRQNKPSIQVAPDDTGTPETAEYLKARIRHIEYEANADTARDCARDQQVTSGRGFARVSTEYVPGTFQQRICIDRIENQFSVIWDPAAVLYDRSDADWCFVISQISKDAHKRRFGDRSTVNQDFAAASQMAPDWVGIGDDGEMVQIAEYFVKEYSDKEVTDPKTGEKRTDKCPTVCQYVINGAEVLDKHEWIGSTIPIVPFWGREATVNGKRRMYSLVRNARGPQKLLNLYVSNIAELIGQMPKTPHKVAVGSIPAGSENDWKSANNSPLAYLLYTAYDDQNRPLPPPSREVAEPPIQALTIGVNQCIDGIKAAMGIYDASLGARSNEQSGLAIARRQKQSNITNYHFPDNEARSNKYLGEILVEIIPLIDQAGKSYPVRTEDGKTHIVPIGQPHTDWKTGQQVCHDLKSGQYSVTVSTGPSYQSQRQEMFERDTALIQADPELMWVIGDQMFAADDNEGSQERAERMKRAIAMKSPGLIQEKGEQAPVPPEVQQKIVGMQQELQKTHAFAQSLHEQLATKQPEIQKDLALKKMDLDFQREKLQVESQTKIDVAALTQGISSDIAHLRAAIETIMHERGIQAQQQSQAATQQHAADMADTQHQNSMEAQTQAQEAAAQQQQQDQQQEQA